MEVRTHGVQLPADTSASALLHRLLMSAKANFDVLASVDLPEDPKAFRARYPEVLPRFEAARAASSERTAIARRVALEASGALVYRGEDGRDRPLAEFLADEGEPLPLTTVEGRASPRPEFGIHHGGRELHGSEAEALLERLLGGHRITRPAVDGIRWALARAADGALDLSGERFVLMGAGAELAPTPLLLRAGAKVLWIDLNAPHLVADDFSGRLSFAEGGADLLLHPREIAATIRRFVGDDSVRLGLFAYAAGRGREWRLEASMNAITHALPRGMVKSMTVYVSPTSAVVTQPTDFDAAQSRRGASPRWQKALRAMKVLVPSHVEHGDVHVARAIVPLQGASYQATQYVAKILVAEAFASARRVGTVSANVAGITNTSSMKIPAFQAAFAGAHHFGVEVFDPATTRSMCALLMLHDVLSGTTDFDPAHPEHLFERQIHGGIYSMPDALDGAIKVAAALGVVRRPTLLRGLLR